MPWSKGASGMYESYLNNMGSYLGQHQVNTGRSATPEMTYGATSGYLRPLLSYDLARRQQQIQNALAWQQGHDQRKQQPSDFEKWTKGIVGGATMAAGAMTGNPMAALSGGKGLLSMFSDNQAGTKSGLQQSQEIAFNTPNMYNDSTGNPNVNNGDDVWGLFGSSGR